MQRTLLTLFYTSFFIHVFSQNEKVKVYLNCNCDSTFIKQNTLFLDYVRDRTLSDIEVFVFDIANASGGRNYTFEFQGKNEFQEKKNQLHLDVQQNLTLKEKREVLLQAYKLGLVYLLQDTDLQNQISVQYNNKNPEPSKNSKDPWKNWVFELSGSFNFEDEKSINEEEYDLDFEIDRVTENWRIRADLGQRRSIKFYSGEQEDYSSERKRSYFSGSVVKSISNHFSSGLFGSFRKDTYRNYKAAYNFSPALEYNFIPYDQVLTREITLAYKIGYNSFAYFEETLYGFLKQNLFNQSLTLNVRYRERWGNIYSYLVASQFLNGEGQKRLTINNSISLRVLRGLSLRLSGNFELIRDQINLAKGETSIEDLLLRQRQISTNYQNRISLGLSYTFGSIYNNIVNTRL
jgi:hypothetical protein